MCVCVCVCDMFALLESMTIETKYSSILAEINTTNTTGPSLVTQALLNANAKKVVTVTKGSKFLTELKVCVCVCVCVYPDR